MSFCYSEKLSVINDTGYILFLISDFFLTGRWLSQGLHYQTENVDEDFL